jgi:hypothetical protein
MFSGQGLATEAIFRERNYNVTAKEKNKMFT